MKLQIKHFAYGAIFLLIGLVVFQSYRLSIKNDKLKQLNSTTVLLEERLKHKTDSINLLETENIILESKSDSLNVIVNELKKDNIALNVKLDSALSAIDSIPSEENYSYLKNVAYNYPGNLQYPFNAKQVAEIRKDYTENGLLNKININLVNTIDVLQKQNSVKDDLILNKDVQIDLHKSIIDSYKTEIENCEKNIATLNKDAIKQKRVKYLFQGVSIVGGVFILISIL